MLAQPWKWGVRGWFLSLSPWASEPSLDNRPDGLACLWVQGLFVLEETGSVADTSNSGFSSIPPTASLQGFTVLPFS